MRETIAMKRLMIFIDETDRWHGKVLSAALVDRLRKEGCAGATVVRGSAGFGGHQKIHTASIMDLSSALPEIIIVIDSAERIEAIMPTVEEMVVEGLVCLDDVQVVKLSKKEVNK